MVVPFDVITIRRDVAEQMWQEIKTFCATTNTIRALRDKYLFQGITPQEAHDLVSAENSRNLALLNLTNLVLENIITPNFD